MMNKDICTSDYNIIIEKERMSRESKALAVKLNHVVVTLIMIKKTVVCVESKTRFKKVYLKMIEVFKRQNVTIVFHEKVMSHLGPAARVIISVNSREMRKCIESFEKLDYMSECFTLEIISSTGQSYLKREFGINNKH